MSIDRELPRTMADIRPANEAASAADRSSRTMPRARDTTPHDPFDTSMSRAMRAARKQDAGDDAQSTAGRNMPTTADASSEIGKTEKTGKIAPNDGPDDSPDDDAVDSNTAALPAPEDGADTAATAAPDDGAHRLPATSPDDATDTARAFAFHGFTAPPDTTSTRGSVAPNEPAAVPKSGIAAAGTRSGASDPTLADDAGDTTAGSQPSLDASTLNGSTESPKTAIATSRMAGDFAAQLAQAHGHGSSAALTPGVEAARFHPANHTPDARLYTTALATPVSSPQFPLHLATEVSLLGAGGIERAEIRLQPAGLGPVHVELTLSGESARIAFLAAQPETRHAIEQSLPILKDLLAERGLMLGNASVSDGGANASGQEGAGRRTASHGEAGGTSPGSSGAAAQRRTLRRSLLDVYA